MSATDQRVKAWIEAARAKARGGGVSGGVSEADIDELAGLVAGLVAGGVTGGVAGGGQGQRSGQLRQRLLYLHANGMSIYDLVLAAAPREPIRNPSPPQVSAKPELPYRSVYDAIMDGWRVVSFPNQDAPYDDRELHVLGYQFILEKMEVFHD